MLLLLLSCALHTVRTGLVEPIGSTGALAGTSGTAATGTPADPPGPVELIEAGGHRLSLQLDADSAPIRYLHDVVVTVEGVRVGSRLVVRDWHVVDAGDGSGGYVGRLRVQGLRVLIEDRNSGSVLVLDDQVSAPLRPYAGKMVLLIGHLVGPSTVAPVAWRLLEPE